MCRWCFIIYKGRKEGVEGVGIGKVGVEIRWMEGLEWGLRGVF